MPIKEYGCEDCFKKKERRESTTGIYGKMICECGMTMGKLVSAFARTAKKWEV
jgi:hypothetical protein